jgi:hypothetical protein
VVVFDGSGFIRGGILHLIVENFIGNLRNLLFIITAAIVNGRINVDNQRIIMCLFIVTSTIINGWFNMDSHGIIICLFIVTAAIINGRFNVDSQGIII